MSGDVLWLCALVALFLVACSATYLCGFAAGKEAEQYEQRERDRNLRYLERNQ